MVKKTIGHTLRYFIRRAHLQVMPSQEFFGIRRSALLEMALFYIVVIGISHVFSDGTRFVHVTPHPFWVIMLLILLQYGANEALVCAVFSSIVLYAWNMPEQLITETMYDYLLRITMEPFLWIATAIVTGGIRTRQILRYKEMKEDLEVAERGIDTITDAYSKVKALNESMETRLAGELSSSINTYKAARALESLNQQDILPAVENVISATLSPKKFSVFSFSDHGFDTSSTYGWVSGDPYASHFPPEHKLYQVIIGGQRIVCAINKEDARILTGEGLLAGPLINNTTGEVFGMLKIEELSFGDLSIHTVETFRVLCEWIGVAYGRAGTYTKVKESSVINQESNLFSFSFFQQQKEFLTALARRVGFDFSMITVKLANAETLKKEERIQSAISLGKAVQGSLRKVDQIFDAKRTGEEFFILLPGTPLANTQIVVDKIKKFLQDQKTTLTENARYSFATQELFDKKDTIVYTKPPLQAPVTPTSTASSSSSSSSNPIPSSTSPVAGTKASTPPPVAIAEVIPPSITTNSAPTNKPSSKKHKPFLTLIKPPSTPRKKKVNS